MECSLTLSQGLHSGSLEPGHSRQMSPPFVLLLPQHGEVLNEVKDILPTKVKWKKLGKRIVGVEILVLVAHSFPSLVSLM